MKHEKLSIKITRGGVRGRGGVRASSSSPGRFAARTPVRQGVMISAPIAAPNEEEAEEEEEDNRDHSVCVWHYCQLCFYYRYEALGLESISKSLGRIVGCTHTRAIRLAGRPRFE
ncbi:hypothetical protein V1478_017892 [Vespula squamosa]|uniref:Uncharacterized protein n=1 Tax=Vespula squamosa TaxID=30214 RepID=A0ABD1ZVG8_VESSQ